MVQRDLLGLVHTDVSGGLGAARLGDGRGDVALNVKIIADDGAVADRDLVVVFFVGVAGECDELNVINLAEALVVQLGLDEGCVRSLDPRVGQRDLLGALQRDLTLRCGGLRSGRDVRGGRRGLVRCRGLGRGAGCSGFSLALQRRLLLLPLIVHRLHGFGFAGHGVDIVLIQCALRRCKLDGVQRGISLTAEPDALYVDVAVCDRGRLKGGVAGVVDVDVICQCCSRRRGGWLSWSSRLAGGEQQRQRKARRCNCNLPLRLHFGDLLDLNIPQSRVLR